MTAAAPPLESLAPSVRETAGLWVRHLLALYLPLNSLLFLWTSPHPWSVAILFMAPLLLAHQLDYAPLFERRQPPEGLAGWPFDAMVYVLAGLQFWIVLEVVRLFTTQGFFSFDMMMIFLVVGGSSGFSIVTAHELIHRRRPWEQRLGRLLLGSVLYEHFFTEHLRGHHVRVGTAEDPATARFGEDYEAFFRRTVPAQLRSAWRLEKKRLGDPEMGLFDRRMLSNRVLHGFVMEWGLALAIGAAFGWVALLAFLGQAFMAVRLLEAVNYFEHWGLVRRGRRVQPADSWDTHSWFTYYALIGLTRHADHHASPARPYQKLRIHQETPLLPAGYVGTVDMVMGQNEEFQRFAAQELGRRRLGPFAPGSADGSAPPLEPEAALTRLEQARAEERDNDGGPGPVGRLWRRIPIRFRWVLVLGGTLLLTAAGVQWETAGTQTGFFTRLLFHGWILAVFAVVLLGRRRIEARVGQNLSWGLAFATILAAGAIWSP